MRPISFEKRELREDLHEPSREAEFLRELALAYRDIYASALSIVGNRADADDVIQEVCVVLWQKYGEFEPGTSFRKWSCTVAFHIAKAFARQQRKRRGFGLSDEALARVSHARTAVSELLELRRDMLRQCLERLPLKDRRFLADCYRGHSTFVDHARKLNMPVATIYTRLKRLRKRLADCIHRSLGDDG